jgi:hypothetical protein
LPQASFEGEGDDILGDGVKIAARIEGIAEPGRISISEDAWRQVQGKVAANFVDAGEQSLKNIARPVRVYRLDLAHKAATASDVPRPVPAQSDKPSIAVLAFNNMSGDPEQEYFSDGISEDIITDLSKLSELNVIARIGLLFVLTNLSLALARWLLYGYVVSRLLHFVAYFTAQIHDIRATFWTVGSLILIFMTCWTLFAALGY